MRGTYVRYPDRLLSPPPVMVSVMDKASTKLPGCAMKARNATSIAMTATPRPRREAMMARRIGTDEGGRTSASTTRQAKHLNYTAVTNESCLKQRWASAVGEKIHRHAG